MSHFKSEFSTDLTARTGAHAESLAHYIFDVGFRLGSFTDTLLSVTAPGFKRTYRVHAIVLSKEASFLDMLVSAERSGDSLWRITLDLPLCSTEDAVLAVLEYAYTGKMPPIDTPAMAVAVLSVAQSLGLQTIVAHGLDFVRNTINADTLGDYLTLLDTAIAGPAGASAVIIFLASVFLDPRCFDDNWVRIYSRLPWGVLKYLLESRYTPTPSAGHLCFEFAKRVLAVRGKQRETAVLSFSGELAGLSLVRRGELRRKLWKVDSAYSN